MSARRTWFAQVIGYSRSYTYTATGPQNQMITLQARVSQPDSQSGRLVDVPLTRERLYSIAINGAQEWGLFGTGADATLEDNVARLRLLVALGVPEDQAREITGIHP